MTDSQLALVLSGVSIVIALAAARWSVGWSTWLYRRTHRPTLTVKLSWALVPNAAGQFLTASVTNTGTVAVTLRGITFRAADDPKRQQLIPTEWIHCSLPKRLEIGESWDAPLVSPVDLHKALTESFVQLRARNGSWRVVAVARDAADTKYLSAPIEI